MKSLIVRSAFGGAAAIVLLALGALVQQQVALRQHHSAPTSSASIDPRLAAVRAFYAAWAQGHPAAAYALLDSGWKDSMSFDEFRGFKDGHRAIVPYYSIQPTSIALAGVRAVKVTYIVPNADTNLHVATWALRKAGDRWLLQGFHDYAGPPASYRPELIVGEDADTALRALVGLSVASDPQSLEARVTATPTIAPPLPQGTQPSLEFHGYACTEDCSGHEAGYNWAEEHDIEDPHTCYDGPKLSDPAYQSFSEGCEAYVDESTGADPLDPGERYDQSDDSTGTEDNP